MSQSFDTDPSDSRETHSHTYVEEQKLLRESFKPFLKGDEDTENDDEDFLKPKIKSAEEQVSFLSWEYLQSPSLLYYFENFHITPNLNTRLRLKKTKNMSIG